MKYQKLISKLNPKFIKLNEPLSKHTTLRIGGPADIFYEPRTNEELIDAIIHARKENVPITMLGWGSNVLVGDLGIRGLVIRNQAKKITIGQKEIVEKSENNENLINQWEKSYKSEIRWNSATEKEGARKMYEFQDLDYDENDRPIVKVVMESGVDLPFAINHLVYQGLTGLQWYGRIPGTIGGAIFNNIHGGTHFIHEIIDEVKVLDSKNQIKIYKQNELKAKYDYSIFHDTKEIILDATFNLRKGDKKRAIYVAQEWTKRKALHQPSNSIGCVFQNISVKEKEKRGWPTVSVGYVVEHVLNMKGFHIGDAWISEKHHNFIENKGKATAQEYLAVIEEIKKRALEKLGLNLKLEIFLLGEFK
ncbi:MAG: UDP-N-acetylenolpyruvoylglucosamine reductase [Candidatus Dojkabacteria bacterium]|nr:MAG: UDP-N-acetylenolpyruvoylglucosamine reductase [Candidatus Dojkabacteria bacterium]